MNNDGKEMKSNILSSLNFTWYTDLMIHDAFKSLKFIRRFCVVIQRNSYYHCAVIFWGHMFQSSYYLPLAFEYLLSITIF